MIVQKGLINVGVKFYVEYPLIQSKRNEKIICLTVRTNLCFQ